MPRACAKVRPMNDHDQDDNDSIDPPARSNEFAQMLEESFKTSNKKLAVGDKVRGEILVVGKEDIFVSVGKQKEGTVPRRDLLSEDGSFSHKVGDVLDLYVTQ